MSRFKPGEEVCYVGHHIANNPDCVFPPKDSIVTIMAYSGVRYGYHCYRLREYPLDSFGYRQSFTEMELRSLIKDTDFVEEVLKKVSPKKEPITT